jgi:hypothetical protein
VLEGEENRLGSNICAELCEVALKKTQLHQNESKLTLLLLSSSFLYRTYEVI